MIPVQATFGVQWRPSLFLCVILAAFAGVRYLSDVAILPSELSFFCWIRIDLWSDGKMVILLVLAPMGYLSCWPWFLCRFHCGPAVPWADHHMARLVSLRQHSSAFGASGSAFHCGYVVLLLCMGPSPRDVCIPAGMVRRTRTAREDAYVPSQVELRNCLRHVANVRYGETHPYALASASALARRSDSSVGQIPASADQAAWRSEVVERSSNRNFAFSSCGGGICLL